MRGRRHGLSEVEFTDGSRVFSHEAIPDRRPTIFNLYGCTAAIEQLLWQRRKNSRCDLNGYRDEGTTPTPFDMLIYNRTSRYHLILSKPRLLRRAQLNGVSKGGEHPPLVVSGVQTPLTI